MGRGDRFVYRLHRWVRSRNDRLRYLGFCVGKYAWHSLPTSHTQHCDALMRFTLAFVIHTHILACTDTIQMRAWFASLHSPSVMKLLDEVADETANSIKKES